MQKITQLIADNPLIVFMKGNKLWPQCGYSSKAVDLLNFYEVDYETYDILTDEELRQAIKEYSNWPTFPQIYLNGELLGGYDILKEMHDNDELRGLFDSIEC